MRVLAIPVWKTVSKDREPSAVTAKRPCPYNAHRKQARSGSASRDCTRPEGSSRLVSIAHRTSRRNRQRRGESTVPSPIAARKISGLELPSLRLPHRKGVLRQERTSAATANSPKATRGKGR